MELSKQCPGRRPGVIEGGWNLGCCHQSWRVKSHDLDLPGRQTVANKVSLVRYSLGQKCWTWSWWLLVKGAEPNPWFTGFGNTVSKTFAPGYHLQKHHKWRFKQGIPSPGSMMDGGIWIWDIWRKRPGSYQSYWRIFMRLSWFLFSLADRNLSPNASPSP